MFKQKHVFKLKTYTGVSVSLDGPIFSATKPNRLGSISNLTLQYGFANYLPKSVLVIPSIGPCYGVVFWRGKYLGSVNGGFAPHLHLFDDNQFHYLGAQFECSILWIGRKIDAGLDVYVNIHKHPDYGFALNWILRKPIKKSKI